MIRKAHYLFLAAAAWFLSGELVLAQDGSGGTADPLFPSPLKDIGGINELIQAIITNIALPLGATLAALAIIYSGFLYVKAQGNSGEIQKAHEAIKWSLVGTAVILGASVIASLIGKTIEALK